MLYLPRSQELAAPSIAPAEQKAPPQRTGTVLLVEDNEEVAEVASAYFQQLGYGVKQAPVPARRWNCLAPMPRSTSFSPIF